MGASFNDKCDYPSGKGCVCDAPGRTPDLSDLPDLNDQVWRKGKRNRAELSMIQTSGVCVCVSVCLSSSCGSGDVTVRKLIH